MALPLGNLYLHLDTTNASSNSGSGTTWFDLTANNGDFSGGDFPAFTTQGTVNTLSFQSGQSDQIFNDTDNYGDLFTGTVPWTIEIYCKSTNGPPTNAFLFGSFPDSETSGWGVKTNGSNGELTNLVLSIGGGEQVSPNISTPENTWVHLVYARDSNSNVRMYKDGVLTSTWTITTGVLTPSSLAYSAIGRRTKSSGTNFPGVFGIIRLWDVALTGAQANEAYINAQNTIFPPPAPVLIGSYDFSDPLCYPGTGETVFDLTANNNDLVMNGAGFQPQYGGTGQSKTFAFLNDNSNFLYCSQFSALGTTFSSGSFTLSTWHNYANAQWDNAAILFGGNGANDNGVFIQVTGNDGNKIYGGIYGDPPAVGIANTANTWHMSTLTGDGATLNLYQDGAFIGSTSQSGSWNGRGFVLGRYLDNAYAPVGTSNQFRYAGLIGIAEVYSGALGSTAISNLYATQETRFNVVPPAPATFKYDFSDPACYPGTGNTIYDLSGYGLDATFTSGTASSFVGSGTSSYFNFDGTGYITTETYANPTPTEWTMLSWVNFSLTSPYGLIMSTAESNTSGGVPHTVWGLTANTIASSNGNNVANISNPSTSNLNEWYMVTYTSDGTTLRLYVNDTQVGSTAISGAFISGTSPYVRLAQYSGVLDSGLNGKIAYAEFYAGNGLTAGEISAIYNSTKIKFDNIKYFYDFSDPLCYPGSGSTVFDLSGSEYDLAISGSPTFGGTGQSKYFEFDGNAANVIYTAATGGLGDTFSVNMWFQIDTTASVLAPWAAGINNNASGNAPFYSINYLSAGVLNNGFNYGVSYAQSGTLTTNTWFMATSTYDGTTNKLYVNGTLVDTEGQGTGTWPSGGFVIGQNINAGGSPGGFEVMDGKVAILEIWDTTLSAGEVSTIFTNEASRFGITPPAPPSGILGGRQFAQGFNG